MPEETDNTSFDKRTRVTETDYRGKYMSNSSREEIDTSESEDFNDLRAKPVEKNIYRLNRYFWYPEGFTEFLLDKDLYNSEYLIEQANLVAGNNEKFGPFGMYVTDFQNTVRSFNKIPRNFGEVKNTIGSITGGNKNNVRLNEGFDDVSKLFEEIPHIKITEFQPRQETAGFLNNLKKLYGILDSLFTGDAQSTRLDRLKSAFSEEGLREIFKEAGVTDGEKGWSDDEKVLKIPNFFYENMIGGTYTAQYYVPYLNQPNYLNAMGQTGWQSRSLKQQFLGNMISGLVDKIAGIGQFDIAGRPKFSLEGNSPLPDQVTTVFNLHNYNIEALEANLEFIHAITAGAFWIQSGFLQISSNLYDIEIPGRFRYYLCKGNVKVDFNGKVRSLSDSQKARIKNRFPEITNEAAYAQFPDMYTITLEFNSLLPNNFNVFLNYLKGGNEVGVGVHKEEKLEKMLNAIQHQITKEEESTPTGAENADKTGS